MSKKWQAVLFDLDGTLLPMDNDHFVEVYFGYLAETVKDAGYTDKDLLVKTIWKGVKAMAVNDGSRLNSEAFWEVFAGVYGEKVYQDIPRFNAFYDNEFNLAREAASPTPLAAEALRLSRKAADRVILATSPVFPVNAVVTRLSWLDLRISDFDLATHYDNCRYSKPNPGYYRDILEQFNLDPARCLMVGNDAEEDMQAVQALGMQCFMLTDYLINRKALPITCPSGSYQQMLEYLRKH